VLVVIDLYPLEARLPRTFADVDDRLHELSFGNRVRQDGETAKRINEFVRTIEELAALVPPDALSGDIEDRISWARAFKTIQVVDIDMQSPAAKGKVQTQNPGDDEFGLRDFSADTVKRRRDAGYKLAHERLTPIFKAA